MEEKEALSYSRLGPMDPAQVRHELAEELAAPTGLKSRMARPRRVRRVRRVRQRRGRE